MAGRAKGQDVRIVVTSSVAGQEDSITAVQSFEMSWQMEIKSEGYLGETANRKDDILMGIRANAKLHLERAAYFRFVQRVTDRAQRRLPASVKFNILASISFPDGSRARVLIEDCYFGELPLNVGGRDEYVESTIEIEASQARILF